MIGPQPPTDWQIDPARLALASVAALARRRVVVCALADAPLGLTVGRLATVTGLTYNQVRGALDGLTWEAPVYEFVLPGEVVTRYVLDTDEPWAWRAGDAWHHERAVMGHVTDDPTPRIPCADMAPVFQRWRWS